MPTVAILPVKSFRLGKGRMAEDLSTDERSTLGQAMAERTASLAVEAGLIPVLVAGDADVADWAAHQGLPFIPDPGDGLDAAAEAGAVWAETSSSSWIVLHADLPLLTREELAEVAQTQERQDWVIAPSADGGTSALGGKGAVRFAYGPGSFHRHLARFPQASVLARLGLLHDVDSYSDLESARRHPRGAWLVGLT
ncbi:MAG: 2-phospho-L-lactate guanylyltransferase [Acidimicrobiia bacterium]